MAEKIRLDQLVFESGLAESREKAKALIMSGVVFIGDRRADKAGQSVSADTVVELRGSLPKYVSRGGTKLEKAVEQFSLSLDGVTAADIGASTGGFTDCMLQNGAKKVYAIDVGYGQLAWKLRNDERVVVLERTNIRNVTPETLRAAQGDSQSEAQWTPLDFCSADVSFISLRLVLPHMAALLGERGRAVCLIKPQFEAGPEKVGKKGVVRDPKVHAEVIEAFFSHAAEAGFAVKALTFSPIKGPEGNIEYLALIEKGGVADREIDIGEIVAGAQESLAK